MEYLLPGYPDRLNMQLSVCIGQLYRHSQGYDVKTFKQLCFDELKRLISFDSGCWLSYEDEQLNALQPDSWIYNMPGSVGTDIPFLFNKPLLVLRPNTNPAFTELVRSTRYPESNQEQKAYHDSVPYQIYGKSLKLNHNLTTIRKNDNGGCQLIGLFRANKKAFFSQQDIDIKTWLTPHLTEAWQLNQLSSRQRDWKKQQSWRAVCDNSGTIKEAEDGFYRLLASHLTNGHKHQLPFDLTSIDLTTSIKLDEIKIDINKVGDNYYLRACKEENRLNRLTDTERQVALLLRDGLRTKAIAERLHSSPRTVEKHLASIYKKFGTANKNDTVAYLILHR
jgi:DNA-binding CsgD family transcriptional regulator